ncbi:MAG: hypothetical protein BWX84_00201 [Verrucomicrobia bacterium ADurb.Bin118]|nr:MAG: hypothetical protein BWX84_00201 [Verrucomicrobia bacterium ADurb.Bin118]
MAAVTPSGRNTCTGKIPSDCKLIFRLAVGLPSDKMPAALPETERPPKVTAEALSVKLPIGEPGKLKPPSGPVVATRRGVTPSRKVISTRAFATRPVA